MYINRLVWSIQTFWALDDFKRIGVSGDMSIWILLTIRYLRRSAPGYHVQHSVSVMGYHLNSLLLFKYVIKQNVSNTNIAKNKIVYDFKIISMVESIIGDPTNFAKLVRRDNTRTTNFAKFVQT